MRSDLKYYYEIKEVPYGGGIYILYGIGPNQSLKSISYFNSLTHEELEVILPENLEMRDTNRLIETKIEFFSNLVKRLKTLNRKQ